MAAKSRSKTPKQRVVPEDLEAVVREALREAAGVKLSGIKKTLPKPYQPFAKEAQKLAEELAHRGEVLLRKAGKTALLFARDPMTTLSQVLLPRLSAQPLSEAELKKVANELAPGHDALLKPWLKEQVGRAVLHQHGSTKSKRFGTQPSEPDVKKMLSPALKSLKTVLTKTDKAAIPRKRIAELLLAELGIPTTPMLSGNGASGNGATRGQFLSALTALMAENPREALLSVRQLRARLSFSKEQFDSIALELMRDGAISLHHHDYPASLAESERNELVQDARGTHYIGIAPRRGA
jgi:hypothetical protein